MGTAKVTDCSKQGLTKPMAIGRQRTMEKGKVVNRRSTNALFF
jgi:hypothetical protein